MSSPFPDPRLPALPLELAEGDDRTRMVVVPGNGTGRLAYKAGPAEQLTVEAVSVSIDVGAVTGTMTVTVTVTDAAGNVVATAQTDANTASATVSQVTFGTGLPDTRQFANQYSDVNAQTGWPPVALDGGATLEVVLGNSDGPISELRLWVEDLVEPGGRSKPLPPRMAHVPLSGR